MGGWVFFAIIIGIAIISALSHALKGQQPEPTARRRTRPQQRRNEGVRVNSEDEQDRFLAEIERLRKKGANPKVVPVVKPKVVVKRASPSAQLRLDELPKAEVVPPVVKQTSLNAPKSTPNSRVAEIATVATIHTISAPLAAGSSTAAKMASMSQTMQNNAETPFSKELLTLLQSKRTMPLAVILHEILGPPKSQRG